MSVVESAMRLIHPEEADREDSHVPLPGVFGVNFPATELIPLSRLQILTTATMALLTF